MPRRQGRRIAPSIGEKVGEIEAVVRLNTFDLEAMPGIPGGSILKEIRGEIDDLLILSAQKTRPGKLVDSGVLIQAKAGIGDTPAWRDLDVDLDELPATGCGRETVYRSVPFR